MYRVFPILIVIMLCSCKKKYIAHFYKEGTESFPTFGGTPTEKTFSAKDDITAYEKSVEMIIELEKNNIDTSSVYKEIKLFYAKSKSHVRLDVEKRKEIESKGGIDYLLDRKQAKQRLNSYISPFIKYQREQEKKYYKEDNPYEIKIKSKQK